MVRGPSGLPRNVSIVSGEAPAQPKSRSRNVTSKKSPASRPRAKRTK